MQTSYENVRELAACGDYKMIPVAREIFSDIRTPLEVLRALRNVSDHCFLLESVEDSRQWGRYTFLGFEPTLEMTCRDHSMTIRAGSTLTFRTNHPGEYIRQIV